MSYILDALRKADAERDRGQVPGIHAQPSFGTAATASQRPAAAPWPWIAAGVLATLLIGALAWYLMGAPRTANETSPVAAMTAPTATPSPAPAPVQPAVVQAAPVQAAPAAITAPSAQITMAVPVPRASSETARPRPDAATAVPSPSTAADKVYTLAELPDDIRRQLPALAIGGSSYSAKAADRILIVNGLVLHEGEKVTPELVLQQIRLKGAVLNFKGYRYAIGY